MTIFPFTNPLMYTRNRMFFCATILMRWKPIIVKPLSYVNEYRHKKFYWQTKQNDQRFFTTKSNHHDIAYQQCADDMMQSMLDLVELPEYTNFIESANLTGDGVLEIVLVENKGTIVLNKHYALKQIWYSASNSIPDYFDYDTIPPWISRRTQQSLKERLLKDIQSSSVENT